MPALTRFIVLIAAIFTPACASTAPRRTLTAEEAVEIARREVAARNPNWVDPTFVPRREGKGWSVFVWRQPTRPGSHCSVDINPQGEVVAFIGGK